MSYKDIPKGYDLPCNPSIGDCFSKYKKLNKGHNTVIYIYKACPQCGKEYWQRRFDAQRRPLCLSCGVKSQNQIGINSPNWKGGRNKNNEGYIIIRIYPEDFFFTMTPKFGYILEHRLVMAKYLSRCLLPWEVVHHINGIKDDNRIENLELLPHGRFHLVDLSIKSYARRVESENIKLKLEIKRLKGITHD